jgi:hypothetical protein
MFKKGKACQEDVQMESTMQQEQQKQQQRQQNVEINGYWDCGQAMTGLSNNITWGGGQTTLIQ